MSKTIAHIHTPTNNPQQSKDFYQKLNYQLLSEGETILFSDGKIVIEINPDRFARAGLKLYKEDWTTEINALSQLTHITEIKEAYLLSDPNGVRVYLMNQTYKPTYSLPKAIPTWTGKFAGLSIEATDLDRSSLFWEALGYSPSMGSAEQGWINFSNGSSIDVSLMKSLACPHLFFNPSMTYFNGKNNLKLIEKIKAIGIPITEEITAFNKEKIVDNIIIRDPGGYGFFIFND